MPVSNGRSGMPVLKALRTKARYNILTPAALLGVAALAAPALAGSITSPTSDYVIGAGGSLTNYSDISGASQPAVSSGGDIGTIDNTDSGRILGNSHEAINIGGSADAIVNSGFISSTNATTAGIYVDADLDAFINSGLVVSGGTALFVGGDLSSFTNTGRIYSTSSYGVDVEGRLSRFSNSGIVKSYGKGVYVGNGIGMFSNSGSIVSEHDHGVYIHGNVGAFTNSGRIFGYSTSVYIDGDVTRFANSGSITSAASYGVSITGTVGAFTNSGRISAYYTGVNINSDVTRFTNSGSIVGATEYGVHIDGDVGVFSNSGSIWAGESSAVRISGDVGTFTNSGSITSGSSTGVYFSGDVTTFTNSGVISGLTGYGVYFSADVTTFTNPGRIFGYDTGVYIDGDVTTFTNSGTIVSTYYDGVDIDGDVGTFTNSGLIWASDDPGVYIGGDAGTFTNSGRIVTGLGNTGVYIDGDVVTFTNSGLIEGGTGVYISGAAGTVLTNSGRIAGYGGTAIAFGAGSDRLVLGTGASFFGTVDFDAGAATFDFSNYRGNMIFGYQSAATLKDVAGPNLYYDNGTDTVYIVSDAAMRYAWLPAFDLVSGVSDLLRAELGQTGTGGAGTGMLLSGYASQPAPSPAETALGLAAGAPGARGPKVWASVIGGGSRDPGEDGVSDGYEAVLAGARGELRPGLEAGVLAGYAHSSLSIDHGPQTVDADTGIAGVYGRQKLESFALDFQLIGGFSANSSSRDITTPTGLQVAKADYNSWFLAPQIGAGTELARLADGTAVGVTGKAGYIAGGVDGYTETGNAGVLEAGSQSFGLLNGSLELDGRKTLGQAAGGAITGTGMIGVFAQTNVAGSAVPVSVYDNAGGTAFSLGASAASSETLFGPRRAFRSNTR